MIRATSISRMTKYRADVTVARITLALATDTHVLVIILILLEEREREGKRENTRLAFEEERTIRGSNRDISVTRR